MYKSDEIANYLSFLHTLLFCSPKNERLPNLAYCMSNSLYLYILDLQYIFKMHKNIPKKLVCTQSTIT